jgi:hypothetical protein
MTHLCIGVVPSLIKSGSVLVLYYSVGASFSLVEALSRFKMMETIEEVFAKEIMMDCQNDRWQPRLCLIYKREGHSATISLKSKTKFRPQPQVRKRFCVI